MGDKGDSFTKGVVGVAGEAAFCVQVYQARACGSVLAFKPIAQDQGTWSQLIKL